MKSVDAVAAAGRHLALVVRRRVGTEGVKGFAQALLSEVEDQIRRAADEPNKRRVMEQVRASVRAIYPATTIARLAWGMNTEG